MLMGDTGKYRLPSIPALASAEAEFKILHEMVTFGIKTAAGVII
jgi:hypothetical protein